MIKLKNLNEVKRYRKFLEYCNRESGYEFTWLFEHIIAKAESHIIKKVHRLKRRPTVRGLKGYTKLDVFPVIDFLEADAVIAPTEFGQHLVELLKESIAIKCGIVLMSYEDVRAKIE